MTIFLQIARNSMRETLRQPVCLLVLLSALVLIGLMPLLTLFVFREQIKLVVDSALATTLAFGWALAVLSANSTISREIRNGTVLMVLAKPVNRHVFLAAKAAGVLAALTIFSVLSGTAMLIAVRVAKDQFFTDNTALGLYFGALLAGLAYGGLVNYLTRGSFCMAAVLALLVLIPAAAGVVAMIPPDEGVERLRVSLVPAIILVWFAVMAMGALAAALSTRLDMMPNLVVCGCIFLLGLVSDHLFGRAAAGNTVAWIVYSLIPNWQLFWTADALAAGRNVPWSYVAAGALYTLQLLLLFLLLAIVLFRGREVGRQDAA